MPSLKNHITRILGEARGCLTSAEIAQRLNTEFGRTGTPYTTAEIEGCAAKMPNLRKSGKKYCRKPEDASQAAARIVREATES
jgi:hypothetical protein